ncbi:CoA transferase [Polaromonas sp. P1-6]|nr:CoA transferase [Polaromonas sp. P1-6]
MQEKSDAAPLEGIVVLDLTRWLAGPYCTLQLADAGATVIKIEPPPDGEITRQLEPLLNEGGGEPVSAYFLRLNRRKKSVCLDLRQPEAREAFLALARQADVVVENFRPGVMDRLGLGQEMVRAVNPRLVYCSISGFGASESPLRAWPSFNLVAEAMTGLVQIDQETGEPRALGPAIGDLAPALHAVAGILMALMRRERTGKGSFVDIAMFDSCMSINELAIGTAAMTGKEFEYGRRVNPNLAPYGLYQSADGYVCIAVASEEQWQRFCQVMESPSLASDPELQSGIDRASHFHERIEPVMTAWLKTRTRDEIARVLAVTGVPASPVQRASEVFCIAAGRRTRDGRTCYRPGRAQMADPGKPDPLVASGGVAPRAHRGARRRHRDGAGPARRPRPGGDRRRHPQIQRRFLILSTDTIMSLSTRIVGTRSGPVQCHLDNRWAMNFAASIEDRSPVLYDTCKGPIPGSSDLPGAPRMGEPEANARTIGSAGGRTEPRGPGHTRHPHLSPAEIWHDPEDRGDGDRHRTAQGRRVVDRAA